LLKRDPDIIPHDGFAEWEIVRECWLQLEEGEPAKGNVPIPLEVENIEAERKRLTAELKIEPFEIHRRPGVRVKWGTFADPWGNLPGCYEYLDK